MITPFHRWLILGTATHLLFLSGPTTAAEARGAASQEVFHDNFLGKLGEGWSIEREDASNWRVGPRGLEVRVQPGNMWGGANNARNVLVHAIPSPAENPVQISVTLSNEPTAQWEQANLVWYYDGGNMVKLGQELVTGRLSIVMGREQGDRARTVAIVPLDAHRVELRLQAFKDQVRGQFRTAPWAQWRDVGECDLPVKGDPKASLHFYNGSPTEEHWVRVSDFSVHRLEPDAAKWPRVRIAEKATRAADASSVDLAQIGLPGGFALVSDIRNLPADPKPVCAQSVVLHRDGTYGWNWNRRASGSKDPTLAGVGLGARDPAAGTGDFSKLKIQEFNSLELDLDAVTRLENDEGDHNLVVLMPLKPTGTIAISLDWYGPASDTRSLHDGYREYGFVAPTASHGEIQYRIRGFRGAPPKINLKAFLDDAVKRGLAAESQLQGVWLGNQIWNGSRGGTLVTKLDLVVNGIRYSSAPTARLPE